MRHLPKTWLAAPMLGVLLLCTTAASAADLEDFLAKVDVRAKADIGDFRADLSATFNLSSGEVSGLFEIFDSPADVYIALRIGEVAHVSVERVVVEYRANKNRGWGVMAKNLGIKPGSAEFHALKQGRLGKDAVASSTRPGRGNGKSGKGHK